MTCHIKVFWHVFYFRCAEVCGVEKNSGGKPHFSNRNVGSLEGFYYIMEKSVRLDFVLLYIEIPLQ